MADNRELTEAYYKKYETVDLTISGFFACFLILVFAEQKKQFLANVNESPFSILVAIISGHIVWEFTEIRCWRRVLPTRCPDQKLEAGVRREFSSV